ELRIRRIDLLEPLRELAGVDMRLVGMAGEQPMPYADQGLVAPRNQEQMPSGAAEQRVLIAARTLNRQGVGRSGPAIDDAIGIAREISALHRPEARRIGQ